MEKYIRISFDNLVKMIMEYANTDKRQEKPAIVWFGDVKDEIKIFSPQGDPAGLAYALSQKDPRITFFEFWHCPLKDPTYVGNRKGGFRKLSEEEINSTLFPQQIKLDLTKVYIHAPYSPITGDRPTSLDYGIMVHNELHKATFIMYPLSWMDKIAADKSGYDEYICSSVSVNAGKMVKRPHAPNIPDYCPTNYPEGMSLVNIREKLENMSLDATMSVMFYKNNEFFCPDEAICKISVDIVNNTPALLLWSGYYDEVLSLPVKTLKDYMSYNEDGDIKIPIRNKNSEIVFYLDNHTKIYLNTKRFGSLKVYDIVQFTDQNKNEHIGFVINIPN